jgi:Nuclease-related domain
LEGLGHVHGRDHPLTGCGHGDGGGIDPADDRLRQVEDLLGIQGATSVSGLHRQGWTVLHDVAVPGSRANGDHLLIGPPGVFLVDSKAWHGTITLAGDGSAWHNGHPLDQTLATVRPEAQQLATT